MTGPGDRDGGQGGGQDRLPPRLLDGSGPAAELLRRALRPRATADAARAWQRMLPRFARQADRDRLRLVLLASTIGALGGATAVLLLAPRLNQGETDIRETAPARAPARLAEAPGAGPAPQPAPPAAVPRPRRLALATAAQPVPSGAFELGDQARGVLAAGGSARARATPTGPELALAAGELSLAVSPQPAGRRLSVIAGPYRFLVMGTVFEVRRQDGGVELRVHEGEVAVERAGRRLAVITAGGSWHSPARALRPAEGRLGASAPARDPCSGRPDPSDRLGCYQRHASGRGLQAEIAAYELGRLRRDALSDPDGALESFRHYRRRFPRGALRTEADLSIVELLPRLGRFQEALAESAAVLARRPGGERSEELHQLRGNIYRDVLRDLASADREYALAAAARERLKTTPSGDR